MRVFLTEAWHRSTRSRQRVPRHPRLTAPPSRPRARPAGARDGRVRAGGGIAPSRPGRRPCPAGARGCRRAPEAASVGAEKQLTPGLRPAIPRFPGDRETPSRRHSRLSRPPIPPTSARNPSLRDDANQWGGRALGRVGRVGELAREGGGSGRRRRGSRATI